MLKWEEDSNKSTIDYDVNIGIQIHINKRQIKTKKDDKVHTICYNDTAHREYNHDRIFGANAFALLSACPGTIICRISKSTKEIKTNTS
jgi:hypothetical protein